MWYTRLALRVIRVRSCVRIPRANYFFILKLENILRSNLNCSTPFARSTDSESSIGLVLVSFIWVEEKISLKYLLPAGEGDVCMGGCPDGVDIAYVQTGYSEK